MVSGPVLYDERGPGMMEVPQQIALRGQWLGQREEAVARDARFAALVERQARFVFRVAYAVLRNSHDCEDVVQETFLKVFRANAWEGIQDERAFLARIAWRTAVDRLRKIRQEPASSELVSKSPNPEEAAIEEDWKEVVHRLMDGLPEDLRQPLALSTVEELKSREIAQVMGIPEGTVRRRLMRARQVLQQKLSALRGGRYGE